MRVLFFAFIALPFVVQANDCENAPVKELHICTWTNYEYRLYGHCDFLSSISKLTREKACPDGYADVDQKKGAAPRIYTAGELTAGSDGQKLINNYVNDTMIIDFNSVRGGEGTYCIFAANAKCTQRTPFTGFNKSIQPSFPQSGDYIVEVISNDNKKAAYKEFSISLEAKDSSLCLGSEGKFCNQSGKEVEEFSMCGNKPSGSDWWQDEKDKNLYFRLTGSSCQQGEDTRARVVKNFGDQPIGGGAWMKENGPEFSPRAPIGPKGPEEYAGLSCNTIGMEEKDKNGQRWRCAEASLVSSGAQTTRATVDGSSRAPASTGGMVCEYYDYTSVNGAKKVGMLEPGKTVTRKIIDRNVGQVSLIEQTVGCANGNLFEVSNSVYANDGTKCYYHDWQSTNGTKETKYLEQDAVVTRKILERKFGSTQLVSQHITCRNGELFAVDSNPNAGGGSSSGGGSSGGGSSSGGSGASPFSQVTINGTPQQIVIRTVKVVNVDSSRTLYINGQNQNVSVRTMTLSNGRLTITTR